MKNSNSILTIILIFTLLAVSYFAHRYYTDKSTKAPEQKYAQKFEYKESEVNKLKREIDEVNLAKMKLQAALDSCKYFIQPCPEVTVKPKVKSKVQVKTYKTEYDSTLQLLNNKRAECAKSEIDLTDQINFRKRQLDTCSYFIGEMDKALTKMTEDIAKLTNEKDSLKSTLETPISITKEFPCVKAKKGTVVSATVIPATGTKDFTVANFNLPKDRYKAAKKSCKKAQSR